MGLIKRKYTTADIGVKKSDEKSSIQRKAEKRELRKIKKKRELCCNKRQISKSISIHSVVDEECRYLIDFLKPNQSDKSLKERKKGES